MSEEKDSIIDQMKNHNHKKVKFKLFFKCLKFLNAKAESIRNLIFRYILMCELMKNDCRFFDFFNLNT